MKPKVKLSLYTSIVLGMLAAAPLAAQAEQSNWIFRVGAHIVDPTSENLQPFLEGTPEVSTLTVDKGLSLTGDITYMFSRHFGLELLLAAPFSHDVDLKPYSGGVTSLGSVKQIPPTLSLVWQFMPESEHFRPYVGAGVNYTVFMDEKLNGDTLASVGLPRNTQLDLEDTIGAAAVVGFDLPIGRNWFFNMNARWMDIGSDAEIDIPGTGAGTGKQSIGTIDVDPFAYGVMIGYRFAGAEPLPEPVAAPAPPPPPPPPPAKCGDSDMDGVCDADDKCPGTPAGTQVDSVGCPMIQTLKVLFDFDSAELRPESITELERVVKFMGDVPFATALVEGHTDSVGTDEYNLLLSDRRSKAVFDYLSSRGVDPARLKSVGKGEAEPIADNATKEGRQENRRVMLIRTDSRM